MEIRHNTKALEEALAQIIRRYDARIAVTSAANIGQGAPNTPIVLANAVALTSWLSRAVSIALVIIAVALAIRLINQTEHPAPLQQQSSPPKTQVTPLPDVNSKTVTGTSPSKTDDIKPGYVTTDFTIFKNTNALAGGKFWEVTAGHAFATQEDQAKGQWQSAWCYFKGTKGKLAAQISLGDRSSISAGQSSPEFDPVFVGSLGLSSGDIENMANRCPWLDGKSFRVAVVPFTQLLVDDAKSDLPIVEAPVTATGPDQASKVDNLSNSQAAGTETIRSDGLSTDISQRLLSVVGMDAPGDDLPSMPIRGITQFECEASCQKNQVCNLATYNTKFNACYLKSAVRKLEPYSSAITFYRPYLNNQIIELSGLY